MYRSPDLRGGNRLAGGSLRTIAAVFVRIQEERDGRYFVLVCFNIFIPCPFLPGCTGGTGLPAALYSRLRRFWFAYKRNGSVGIWFWCVSTTLYHVHFSRAARGEPACRWLSTHRRGDFGPHTSGTGGCGFGFRVFQQLNSLSMSSPGCAGGTGFPAALYARLRRFLFAYRNGRVGIWL